MRKQGSVLTLNFRQMPNVRTTKNSTKFSFLPLRKNQYQRTNLFQLLNSMNGLKYENSERFYLIFQIAFKGITHLNHLQSRVYESAYHSNTNLLVCAPTGAGKTVRPFSFSSVLFYVWSLLLNNLLLYVSRVCRELILLY